MKRIAVVMLMLLAVGLTACATTATPPDAAPTGTSGCGKPEQCRAAKRAMMDQILRDFAARPNPVSIQP